MPIGNLTSQLFANIYLNEFDQFIKHRLKIKNYIRYTDDFLFFSDNRKYLENLVELVENFLKLQLKLSLHPQKIILRKYRQGIDFLGYVLLPHNIVVRTKTKKRILRKFKKRIKEYKEGEISQESLRQSLASYLGVLSHTDSFKLENYLKSLLRKPDKL